MKKLSYLILAALLCLSCKNNLQARHEVQQEEAASVPIVEVPVNQTVQEERFSDLPVEPQNVRSDHKEYVDFFEEVYETITKNYYLPIPREEYEKFLKKFDEKIYSKLNAEGKSIDYIRWRGAAFMVEQLKTKEDVFSAFFPPKPAEKFEQVVLGKQIDIGVAFLEGEMTDRGFLVANIEPRSDAYIKGLRPNNIIVSIDGVDLVPLSDEELQIALRPTSDKPVKIFFLDEYDQEKEIEVVSKEYFKQTVFMIPLAVEDVYCLQVQRFNKKTSDDLLRYLVYIKEKSPNANLILDLRGNPGGPPLAAKEIASFFLTPNEEFAFFQKRGQPKALMHVPEVPQKYRFDGDLVVLINEGSGSSSELFSGVMQFKKRATLMGINTAGLVMLKSMFNFDDGSMVLLVTALGQFPDGSRFSFNGVSPDYYVKDVGDQLIRYAASYLSSNKKNAN